MRLVLKSFAVGMVALALLWLATWAPNQWQSPAPGDPGVEIALLDHGWHSGLALPLPALAAAAENAPSGAGERLAWLAGLYPDAGWVEIGWGDAAFYQATTGVGDIDPWLAVRALAWPTEGVVQAVPLAQHPAEAFRRSDQIAIILSPQAFQSLAEALAASLPGPAIDAQNDPSTGLPVPPPNDPPGDPVSARALGPSLYGDGAFYPSPTRYHLFRTCNHWVAGLLRVAGLPASPVPATLSAGLMTELRWRLDAP
ncbi:MAG: DUF2459 domain-containing protein [Pseudomonadota bacterium]